MTDFAALLDRSTARRIRGRLAAFLAAYQHIEFGVRRKLDLEEAALILAAMDAFYVHDSGLSLGMSGLHDLYARLAMLAATEDVRSPSQVRQLRNGCFDALAALKAMEAKLAGILGVRASAISLPERWPTPANDL